jgi:hypothetical protein
MIVSTLATPGTASQDLERGVVENAEIGVAENATGPRQCVLQVIDVSFAPESPPPIVRLKWFENSHVPIEAALVGIPELAPKTARIYIHAIPSLNYNHETTDRRSTPRRKLYQHLERVLGRRHIERFPHYTDAAIRAGLLFSPEKLRSQWTEVSTECTFGIRNMSVAETSEDLRFPYSPAYRVSEFHSFVRCMPHGEDKLIGTQS